MIHQFLVFDFHPTPEVNLIAKSLVFFLNCAKAHDIKNYALVVKTNGF